MVHFYTCMCSIDNVNVICIIQYVTALVKEQIQPTLLTPTQLPLFMAHFSPVHQVVAEGMCALLVLRRHNHLIQVLLR